MQNEYGVGVELLYPIFDIEGTILCSLTLAQKHGQWWGPDLVDLKTLVTLGTGLVVGCYAEVGQSLSVYKLYQKYPDIQSYVVVGKAVSNPNVTTNSYDTLQQVIALYKTI